MAKSLITAVTVNYNTSDFINVMLYALEKLTLNPYRVIICDNGSKKGDILKLIRIAQRNPNVEVIFRKQSEEGSVSHGRALDILIDRVNTRYTVVLDSDCSLLLKGWDEKLIKEINDEVKIVGAGFPSVDREKRIRGEGFPLPFISLFETAIYKKLNITCLPGDGFGKDTCWQWKQKMTDAGYKGTVLTGFNTRYYKEGRFGSILGVAEYFTPEDELIACHFGRGSSLAGTKYLKWLRIPVVAGFLKRYFGKRDKRRWINTCRDIIDEQTS